MRVLVRQDELDGVEEVRLARTVTADDHIVTWKNVDGGDILLWTFFSFFFFNGPPLFWRTYLKRYHGLGREPGIFLFSFILSPL
jgi:hypothetical protein